MQVRTSTVSVVSSARDLSVIIDSRLTIHVALSVDQITYWSIAVIVGGCRKVVGSSGSDAAYPTPS